MLLLGRARAPATFPFVARDRRRRSWPRASLVTLALPLALTSCFKDPGGDSRTTGDTTGPETIATGETTSIPDLPVDETSETGETTGCETEGCGTTGATGCVASPPDDGCVVPDTHATVQEALDDVSCAEVYLRPGVYKGALTITRDVVLGTDCEEAVVLDGDGEGATITITGGHTVLSRLIITGGRGVDGGGIHNEGSLDLVECSVQTNEAARGGGIFSVGPLLVLQGSVILDNLVTLEAAQQGPDDNRVEGGGVYVSGGDVALSNGTIIASNRVDLTAPFASGRGGGLRAHDSIVTITDDSALRDNVVEIDSMDGASSSRGGGVFVSGASELLIDGVTIRNNHVIAHGFSGSIEASGGGAAMVGGQLTLLAASVRNNEASADTAETLPEVMATARGGGLFIELRDGDDPLLERARVLESTISTNTAVLVGRGTARGGGVDVAGPDNSSLGTVTLERSTINGNWASADESRARGGGLSVTLNAEAATFAVAIRQSTFANNNAKLTGDGELAVGGAIYATTLTATGKLALQLSGATISANTADGDVGNLGIAGGLAYETDVLNPVEIVLRNSILADNAADGGNPDCLTQAEAGLQSAGFNLIGALEDCALDNMQESDVIGVPAGLIPLADNGGPTQTMAISVASPALEGGDPMGCADELANIFDADQRGSPRVSGERCDIGAYELQQ